MKNICLPLTLACQGLEDIFRASVFKMLKDEGKINDDTIRLLKKYLIFVNYFTTLTISAKREFLSSLMGDRISS